MRPSPNKAVFPTALIAGLLATSANAQIEVTPAEARAIAKEAYIYGYPMVDGYRVMYTYFMDTEHPEFKAPWNRIANIPRVFTSEVLSGELGLRRGRGLSSVPG